MIHVGDEDCGRPNNNCLQLQRVMQFFTKLCQSGERYIGVYS